MHSGDTVLHAVLLPCELKDGDKHIVAKTNYPFQNSICYQIDTREDFTFAVRIPAFAKNASINGKPAQAGTATFAICSGHTEIQIAFETVPYFQRRPHNLCAVRCGSLIFSVPVAYEKRIHEYETKGVVRKFPYCDYEFLPTSPWNFAYIEGFLTSQANTIGDIPFSAEKPPVVIRAKVRQIPWGLEDGYETVCAKKPESVEPISDAQDVTLIPYGCAKLRMTELPVIKG
jgi:hypothetical protein